MFQHEFHFAVTDCTKLKLKKIIRIFTYKHFTKKKKQIIKTDFS